MAITGRMLVSAIEAMVDVDTRSKRVELAERMSSQTHRMLDALRENQKFIAMSNKRADMAARDLGVASSDGSLEEEESRFAKELERQRKDLETLGNHADQMFDALRRADMMASRLRSSTTVGDEWDDASGRAFHEVSSMWGLMQPSFAGTVFEKLNVEYQKLKSELFASRSQAAHVNAVLRPFKRKYFEIWKESKLNGGDFDKWAREIHVLAERPIADTIDLSMWAKDVYDVFSKLAVLQFDPETRTRPDSNAGKPLGAISASSERTYRQQWFSWIEKNDERLLQHLGRPKEASASMAAFEGAHMDSLSTSTSSFSNFESVMAPVPAASSVVPAAAMSQTAAISVRLVNQEDQSLFADRTWNKSADALQQVGPWIATLERIWGKSTQQVLTTLEIDLPDGATKLNLPQQGLGTLTQVVRDAIDSLT